jgi:hypothetical protein
MNKIKNAIKYRHGNPLENVKVIKTVKRSYEILSSRII